MPYVRGHLPYSSGSEASEELKDGAGVTTRYPAGASGTFTVNIIMSIRDV